jgi:UDP-N-acetyl-D-glucosamine/UDP-N-acetyl-D-galactosamine dehydrogenase
MEDKKNAAMNSIFCYSGHHAGNRDKREIDMIRFESLVQGIEQIAVVGLGYVGLPLAVHLSRHFRVVGYDIDRKRIAELTAGRDRTREVEHETLSRATVSFTAEARKIADCRLIIVAVPTPIDRYRNPDLEPLRSATVLVGEQMARGSCVVYESTVFPGATEEVCEPILAQVSGLTPGCDFTLGYSPERINPGDKAHSIDRVVKVVAGADPDTLELLARVYGTITSAGIHRAGSIRVAEAAKVIENTQRDLNIALIFDRLGIDTTEVLRAASTKWNFLPFHPGLVGGHCIGVDPYYLTFKAESIGYHPRIILAGRRINDAMGKYVAERTVKMLIQKGKPVNGARIGILGVTFKEDVPDLRNTKVVDIIRELVEYGASVLLHDPLADPEEASDSAGLHLTAMETFRGLDAVILAVPHREYRRLTLQEIKAMCGSDPPLLVDIKGVFEPSDAQSCGIYYWRL